MWSFRAWRRRRVLARHPIPGSAWAGALAALPVLRRLPRAGQERLRDTATLLLHGKPVHGADGLEPDRHQRVVVTALAALPVLGLDLGWYDNWHEIVLYPEVFLQDHEWIDEAGVMHREHRALEGESWQQGPIVLSWPDVAASGQGNGYNLVIHEIAHKLDMLNGDANGHPPLHRGMNNTVWHDAFSVAYADLVERVEAQQPTTLDPYAATAPEEFFAVASEVFFEIPRVLRAAYPAVYGQLALFYRQEPREWG